MIARLVLFVWHWTATLALRQVERWLPAARRLNRHWSLSCSLFRFGIWTPNSWLRNSWPGYSWLVISWQRNQLYGPSPLSWSWLSYLQLCLFVRPRRRSFEGCGLWIRFYTLIMLLLIFFTKTKRYGKFRSFCTSSQSEEGVKLLEHSHLLWCRLLNGVLENTSVRHVTMKLYVTRFIFTL